jgi:hypothetical protein
MVQPELSGANRASYEEDIGVDGDPEELKALEESDLCKPKGAMRPKKVSFSAAAQGSPDSGHGGSKATTTAGTKRKRA